MGRQAVLALRALIVGTEGDMRMMDKRQWNWVARLALAALATTFASCSGTDPDPARTQIGSGSVKLTDPATASDTTGGKITADFALASMHLSSDGALEVSADWGSSSNNVDVGIISGSCSLDQMLARQCADPFASSATRNRPETLRTNISAGNYTLLFVNFGPGAENVSYKVYLTPTK